MNNTYKTDIKKNKYPLKTSSNDIKGHKTKTGDTIGISEKNEGKQTVFTVSENRPKLNPIKSQIKQYKKGDTISIIDKQESNGIKIAQQKQTENIQQPGNIIHISSNPGNKAKTTINDNHTVQDRSSNVVEKILNEMKTKRPKPESINPGLNRSKERNKNTPVIKENKEKIVEEDLSSLEVDDWIFKIGK